MKHVKPPKKTANFGFCINGNTLTVVTDKFTVCLGEIEAATYIERIDKADFSYLQTLNEKQLKDAYVEILNDIKEAIK